jgi:hypothetical protein
MTKPTMNSQLDSRNFKPLDMSKIPGYPRQIPLKYEKWLPRFTGGDRERVKYHMSDFWDLFLFHHINDDAEYLVMKLFSATLYGNSRKWYENLCNASITTMEQLEETFFERWGIQLEDISVLLKRLEHIKQTEKETIRHFQDMFEGILYQIPEIHHPEDKYIIHLYTNALLVHLGFPLSKKGPRTLIESHIMATRIEKNISLSKVRHLFTSCTLSMEGLVSLETFTVDFQKEGEQTIDQKKDKGNNNDEVFQSHNEKQRTIEDTIDELEPEETDEVSMCTTPFDEAIHEPFPPAQEEENEVSHFPFQDLDNALFYDSRRKKKWNPRIT